MWKNTYMKMTSHTSSWRAAIAVLLLAAGLTLAACGRSDDPATAATAAARQAQTDTSAIANAPWLRERLPADAIAYIRLPSLWSMLSAPNGKIADAMYASPENVQAVTQLRQALAGFGLTDGNEIDDEKVGAIVRALNGVSGPIELAVIAPGRVATPASQALLTTTLDTEDPERVADYIRALSGDQGDQPLRFDEQGFVQVPAGPGMAYLHFDRSQRRLTAVGGGQVSADTLTRLREQLDAAAGSTHAMHTLEAEIDAQGQGLFAWMDMTSVKPMLMLTLDGSRLWLRHVYEGTRAVALGWGAVDGHGRLSLRAEVVDPAWLSYLPRSAHKLNVRLRGEPGYVLTLATPTATEAQALVDALTAGNSEARQGWQKFEDQMREAVGFGVIEFLEPFGAEMAVFNDDAGDLYASRLLDAGKWHALVGKARALGHHYESRQVSGGTIHYVRVRFNGEAPPWEQFPVHLYWIEEDGWMISSSIPQPLIDRLALSDTGALDEWLQRTQGDDRANALLSLSGTAKRLSRLHYHLYLSLLTMIGDSIGSSIDLFTLPTARQLGLPDVTGMGLQLVANDTRVALDLNYQHSALDSVIGGGGGAFTVVAVAGIAAAISLPAYQDYTTRAQLASALAEATSMRVELAEHYANDGRLLTDPARLEQPVRRLSTDNGRIEFDNGAIAIVFDDEAEGRLAGSHIYLLPYRDANGSLGFTCGDAEPPAGSEALMAMEPGIARTDIALGILPSHCRP